ncbi:uncharacterized protein Z518_09171 [Rhinocladiella mackenziei CBS 650.93]|uniref:Uncharacterized protein n=1 Tax=Rhinocladiella mackenziei CBS 650.93 TaxID=1442369 RepID=A0A0D2IY03_9EURO|nr:uncharacterized protein Z518_09171 [Rhinocladiella mackenziei CBS 650.93]KIX01445.1 hypothetical protein Z518_09171 [Rhinocladiella mackenziei CBS 650.93]
MAKAEKDASYYAHTFTMASCGHIYGKGLGAGEGDYHLWFSPSIVFDALKDLSASHSLTKEQRKRPSSAYDKADEDLALHAPTISEGYGVADIQFNSELARPDEDPYQALFEVAQKCERNDLKEVLGSVRIVAHC